MKLSPPPVNYLLFAAFIAAMIVFANNKYAKVRTTLGGKV